MELLGRHVRWALVGALMLVGTARPAACTVAGHGAWVLHWQADLGRGMGRQISIAQGRIAASTLDRRTCLLSLATGDRLWQTRRDVAAQAGVTLAGDYVAGIGDLPAGDLFVLHAGDGSHAWRQALGESWGAPLIAGGTLYAASLMGQVVACDLAGAGRRWAVRVPGLIRAPLALCDSLLLVPTVSDTLLALRASTGAVVWQVAPGGALYGPPAMQEGLLWGLSYAGRLTAWDAASGREVERLALEGRYRNALLAEEGLLFALSDGGLLSAIDPRRRVILWQEDLQCAADLPPAGGAHLIWTALRDGTLRAFEPNDGRQAIELKLPAPPATNLIVEYPYLIMGTVSGEVIAFRCRAAAQGRGARLRSGRPGGLTRLQGSAWPLAAPRYESAAPGNGGELLAARSMAGDLCRAKLEDQQPRGAWWQGGRPWAAAWLLGTGLALVLQEEADDSYQCYERAGARDLQQAAWDRAEQYDRYALAAWVAGEVCFLMALRYWLSSD